MMLDKGGLGAPLATRAPTLGRREYTHADLVLVSDSVVVISGGVRCHKWAATGNRLPRPLADCTGGNTLRESG